MIVIVDTVFAEPTTAPVAPNGAVVVYLDSIRTPSADRPSHG